MWPFLLLSTALLQTTWVVDDDGGVGVDFIDLPPAIAAAAEGDRLLVRAGSYSDFDLVGKGLVILGEGLTTRIDLAPGTSTIADLPRGSRAYLDGLHFPSIDFATARLAVSGAHTRVGLRGVTLEGPVEDFSGRAALDVRQAEVVLQDCLLTGGRGYAPFSSSGGPGGYALAARAGARIVASACSFLGGGGAAGHTYAGGGGSALLFDGARGFLAGCLVRGGPGAVASSGDIGDGGYGVRAVSGGQVRLAGGASARVEGGSGSCPPNQGLDIGAGARVVVHAIEVWTGSSPFGLCEPEQVTSGFDAAPRLPSLTLSGQFTLTGSLTLALEGGPAFAPFSIVTAPWPSAGRTALAGALSHRPVLGEWFVIRGATLSGLLSASGDFQLSLPAAWLAAGLEPFALQARVLLPSGRTALSGGVLASLR